MSNKSYPWEYHPGFMDLTDPTVLRGTAIKKGARVRVVRCNPPMFPRTFRIIEDTSGNRQSVWKQSLVRPTLKQFKLVWSPEGRTHAKRYAKHHYRIGSI